MNGPARFARAALGIAFVAGYEIGAHYAVSTPGLQIVGLALALAPLMALTLGAALQPRRRAWMLPLWLAACAALWVLRAPLARHFEWGLYLEHVSFNLALAAVFGRTLRAAHEPLCSRFATMVHGPLTPVVAVYTRRITLAWTLFFITMAGVSTLLFALTSIVVWSTFANYLMLPLVVLMFAAEYGCRRAALPGERSGILDGVRAYRRSMRDHAVEAR
ncbi:hypothetical protein [Trinickia mobilis]|uniref:COG4648 family protein n=1 Tax=Trinickia mobilis TaxID=2816356 RepID=UPI001A8C25B2|nr:hypothetical protein [Trinickia mobilis]